MGGVPSYETGRATVYVQPFPATGAKYQLAAKGGVSPRHHSGRPTGRSSSTPAAGRFEVVPVTTQPTFAFGNPVAMPRPFRNNSIGSLRDWDIAPDGKFLGLVTPGSVASGAPVAPEIRVVVNWFEELASRAPTGK